MTSHQIFSGQLQYLTGKIIFDQTNLLYIINGEVIELEVIEFLIGKPVSEQFLTLIISTVCTYVHITHNITTLAMSIAIII